VEEGEEKGDEGAEEGDWMAGGEGTVERRGRDG
jgi:hypothetical protein